MNKTYYYFALSVVFTLFVTGLILLKTTELYETAAILIGCSIGIFIVMECSIYINYKLDQWDSDSLYDPDEIWDP